MEHDGKILHDLPNSITSARSKMLYVFFTRLLLGVGIGGDYLIFASVVAEQSQLRKRRRMLGWIFSNQG